MLSEKEIQNQILDYLTSLHIGYFWQNDSVGIKGRRRANRYRPNGVSDIIGCCGGRFVAIEVKTRTNKQQIDQRIFEEKIRFAGGIYILARSIEDVSYSLQSHGLL